MNIVIICTTIVPKNHTKLVILVQIFREVETIEKVETEGDGAGRGFRGRDRKDTYLAVLVQVLRGVEASYWFIRVNCHQDGSDVSLKRWFICFSKRSKEPMYVCTEKIYKSFISRL